MEVAQYAPARHGSIGELRPGVGDGSCKGGTSTRRVLHPLHAEAQKTTVTAIHKAQGPCSEFGKLISVASIDAGNSHPATSGQVRKCGISTIKGPQEWAEINITVDSVACVLAPRHRALGQTTACRARTHGLWGSGRGMRHGFWHQGMKFRVTPRHVGNTRSYSNKQKRYSTSKERLFNKPLFNKQRKIIQQTEKQLNNRPLFVELFFIVC